MSQQKSRDFSCPHDYNPGLNRPHNSCKPHHCKPESHIKFVCVPGPQGPCGGVVNETLTSLRLVETNLEYFDESKNKTTIDLCPAVTKCIADGNTGTNFYDEIEITFITDMAQLPPVVELADDTILAFIRGVTGGTGFFPLMTGNSAGKKVKLSRSGNQVMIAIPDISNVSLFMNPMMPVFGVLRLQFSENLVKKYFSSEANTTGLTVAEFIGVFVRTGIVQIREDNIEFYVGLDPTDIMNLLTTNDSTYNFTEATYNNLLP